MTPVLQGDPVEIDVTLLRSGISSLSSVEWIEEAPSGQNGVRAIGDFGAVCFSGAAAFDYGQNVSLDHVGGQQITLLNAHKQPLAVPSAIGSDDQRFTVERTSAPGTTTRRGCLH